MGFIEYSFSKLDDANYCLMRYYLRWVEKVPVPNTPFFFKGSFFHEIMEHFWDRLGTPEEVAMPKNRRDKNGKKYSSAEEFERYAYGKWMNKVIQNKFSKDIRNKVGWDRSGQEYSMAKQIKDICFHIFEPLVELGKPLYQEVPFDFVIGHRIFRGRIDAIRLENGKVIIEDYKTGRPWMGEMKVNHDPQMSMYNVGLAALCFKNKKFAESLGFSERKRQEFATNPTHLVEEIENRFVMLEAPAYWASVDYSDEKVEAVPFTHKTKRSKKHFFEILKMLDGVEKRIKHGIIYPERGRKCDSCIMKKPCEARLEDSLKEIPEIRGQIVFDYVAPVFVLPLKKEETSVRILETPVAIQESFSFKRKSKKIKDSLFSP